MSLRPRKIIGRHQGHRIVAAPALEPVDLNEAREILRSPPRDEDDFIESCITTARSMFEGITGIACITQEWKLSLDRWPSQTDPWWDGVKEMAVSELHAGGSGPEFLDLPRYPLQSVDAITTYDQSDTANSITVNDVFFVDTESFPGRLSLRSGQAWPTALRQRNAVEIEYTAGFGAAASDVPDPIKRAILQTTAFLFDNRGSACSPGAALTASGALQIAAEYVTVKL